MPINMKSHLLLLATFSLISLNISAHDGGHGQAELWLIEDQPILAEFIKYENETVYLLNQEGEINQYTLEAFSPKHQQIILTRHQHIIRINRVDNHSHSNVKGLLLAFAACLFALGLIWLLTQKRNRLAPFTVLAFSLILFATACSKDKDPNPMEDEKEEPEEGVPANDITFLKGLFESFASVSTESDSEWFYIESNGLPEHGMMVGITNWQQQVPVDQNFTGDSHWQIPIQPVVADQVLPMENEFFRNAIGIGVNGVPLYHPMTNAGVDAYASGQLDQWYGHSGRADDYHYHIPPTHLASTVGAGMPVAYALDGFPIYGATTETLDENLGRYNEDGGYQYHTVIDEYPYFMANLVGEVTYTETPDGQNTVYEITPQPRTFGARPSTDPLGGNLEIKAFESTGTNAYKLTYTLNGDTYIIRYSWIGNTYTYEFEDPSGSVTTENYTRS